MIEEYRKDLLVCMDDVLTRISLDPNYEEAVWELPKDHWYSQWTKYRKYSKESNEFLKDYFEKDVLLLAELMEIAEYPASFRLDLGDHEVKDGNGNDSVYYLDREVNDVGAKVVQINLLNELSRQNLATANVEEKEWRTFRDVDISFECLYSKRNVVPLKSKWLYMED